MPDKQERPERIEKARFGLGCFWHPDDSFSKLPGVAATRVGYAGGAKENPTYEDLGDHTETVEVDYHPDQISYEQLLGHFFSEHDPTAKLKTQYKSVIFPTNAKQRQVAEKVLENKRKAMPGIQTAIQDAESFTLAEDYHQKFLQKQRGTYQE